MDLSEKSAFLKIASSVAKAAGERLSAIAERRVNSDAGNDVKLQEDVESEMFIRGKLETTGIPVIGEENGGDCSRAQAGFISAPFSVRGRPLPPA